MVSAEVKANQKNQKIKRYSGCIAQMFVRSAFKTWNTM